MFKVRFRLFIDALALVMNLNFRIPLLMADIRNNDFSTLRSDSPPRFRTDVSWLYLYVSQA
jgi:hypothetical protein